MEGGKRWQRLNLSEAIKTVKVPRVVTTSQESPCSIIRQTSSNSLQDPGLPGPPGQCPPGPPGPPGQCPPGLPGPPAQCPTGPPASLSRSASNSGKHTRLRQAVSPSQAQEAQETQEEVTNVVLLDSGIASIEDSSSARSMVVGVGGVGGKCNGRLQRTSRIEESEPVERSWRVQEQQEPLVTTVPGLTQTNSRCNVQTSGWL